MASNIAFICPYCRASPMESPEQLCLHVEEEHNAKDLVAERHFANGRELERWLNRIEESRCEGGMLGSGENATAPIEETEFYILCNRKAAPQLPKRRRIDSAEDSDHTYVSCTAFVHIEEKMDGSFLAKYCLDHTKDCEVNNEPKEPQPSRKTNPTKRRSQEEIAQMPCSSQAGSARPCSSDLIQTGERLGLTTMNRFLNRRIDTAANSLKALNQMIADLAMDINNRLWESPPIMPVHLPEIYTS